MNASYEYFYVEQAVGNLDIEDIGNCCIQANNDNCEFYYLVILTDYGITRVLEYGPYVESYTPLFITSAFQQFDYNEQRIDKLINKFLNNQKRQITQAILVDFDDIKNNLVNPINFIQESGFYEDDTDY